MKLIELTSCDFKKFYLRADLIERIIPVIGSGSEILTTTGRWIVCLESPIELAKLFIESQQR